MSGFGRCATKFPSEPRGTTDAETKTAKTTPLCGKDHFDRRRTRVEGRKPFRYTRTAQRWPRCIKPRNAGFLPICTRTLCLWSPARGTSFATLRNASQPYASSRECWSRSYQTKTRAIKLCSRACKENSPCASRHNDVLQSIEDTTPGRPAKSTN